MWILAAIGAYFIFGVVSIGDRLLLTKTIRDPLVYVFFIGIAALSGLLLVPFVPAWPSVDGMLLAGASGVVFLFGIWPLMAALRFSDASRVFPASGGIVTIVTFLLAATLLGETLSGTTFIAFIFLFIGYIFLTLRGAWRNVVVDVLDWHIILAAVLIAVSLVMRKAVFETEPFLGAWIAIAGGMALGSFSLLLLPHTGNRIVVAIREGKNHHLGMVFVNQAGGAIGAFFQNLAIALGPVAVVQALQGVQYVFILLFALILTRWFPKLLSENFGEGLLTRKVIGVVTISVGVGLLVLA